MKNARNGNMVVIFSWFVSTKATMLPLVGGTNVNKIELLGQGR